jgi:hypothetical protein
MPPDELERIAASDVQEYIFSHSNDDEKKLILQSRAILGVSTSLIAQQIAMRRKAETKLPCFYHAKGIIYPPTLNWEQCSSEATANFKAEIFSRELGMDRPQVADLTGGFGVDSFFFSKNASSVDFIEPDLNLLNMARHNHVLLGSANLRYHQTSAEEFLYRCNTTFDLIYLDPSRRDLNSKKVFRLADCQPDVNNLLPQIFGFAKFVLIKTSPLLDIHQGINELNAVKKVIVVSVNNECKELLFLVQKDFSGELIIETYNVDKSGDAKQVLSFTCEEEKKEESDFSEPQTYLYEPNASILKAGAFKLIGKKYGVQKLHVNTHFYTSDDLHLSFPGRVFKIDQLDVKAKNFADTRANVITRNYPLKAEELKKKLKLLDGGEKYVIGFSSAKKKYVVLATRLV